MLHVGENILLGSYCDFDSLVGSYIPSRSLNFFLEGGKVSCTSYFQLCVLCDLKVSHGMTEKLVWTAKCFFLLRSSVYITIQLPSMVD